jgi:predicted SAM-dependent methyltransferase
MKSRASSKQAPPLAEPDHTTKSGSSAAPEKTVLNVGCGYPLRQQLHASFQGPGWREVRHDIDTRSEPEIVCPLTDMEPVASGSVDAIWSSHNLAHLYRHEVPLALGEFVRVLRPGGLLLLAVLDLQKIAQLVIADDSLDDAVFRTPSGPITPLDMIFGHTDSIGEGAEYMSHKSGFTASTLRTLLADAGFVEIGVARVDYDLRARAQKPAE